MGRRVCLIDYENTALPGLDGLENLDSGDCVRIICSNESIGNTLLHILSIYRDRNIVVEVEYMNQRGSNALDFRLSCDLGYFIAQGDVEQIYVVSKDKGYLHAISEASALNSDVLIVCGASIRDALVKVERGMTDLPIEDYIKPCKDTKQADAELHMEWQKAKPAKETGAKTAKALELIKKKMPVVGKKKQEEVEPQQSGSKYSGIGIIKADAKIEPRQQGANYLGTGIVKSPVSKAKESPEKPESRKNTGKKAGNTKSKAVTGASKTKSQADVEAMTNAQRKKLQQEIKNYMKQTTEIEANYIDHIAALVVKEHSVMDFRRGTKKVLGKKYEALEAATVAVYMHYRK